MGRLRAVYTFLYMLIYYVTPYFLWENAIPAVFGTHKRIPLTNRSAGRISPHPRKFNKKPSKRKRDRQRAQHFAKVVKPPSPGNWRQAMYDSLMNHAYREADRRLLHEVVCEVKGVHYGTSVNVFPLHRFIPICVGDVLYDSRGFVHPALSR